MLAHLVVVSTRTSRESVPAAQAAKPAGRPRPIPPPGSRGTRQAVCESRARTCLPPPFIPERRANQCWFLLPSKRSTSARHPRCCESQRRGEWLHTVSPSGEDGDLAIRLSSTKRIGEGISTHPLQQSGYQAGRKARGYAYAIISQSAFRVMKQWELAEPGKGRCLCNSCDLLGGAQ